MLRGQFSRYLHSMNTGRSVWGRVQYVTSALGEYSKSGQVPLEVMRCDLMQSLWDQTHVIFSITNDLLSLRKESNI
ncbi:hypothetical protein GGR53DRAFT_480922 [Hypoxylon sp. FL1150]|nr:hypothetical protein GGR53DRAFT_480922 [Hypoxylon sp. FL1150]